MFGDGADSNANIALSAALRQQLQITCISRPYDRSPEYELYLSLYSLYPRKIVFLSVRCYNDYCNARN